MKYGYLFIASVGMVVCIVLLFAIYRPGPTYKECVIYIPPDMTERKVALLLEELGVIRSAFLFEWWARLTGKITKAGEYAIKEKSSLNTIATHLHGGPPFLRKLTVPEGFTSTQIVDLLNREPMLQGSIQSIPPEGVLWPETYHFQRYEKRGKLLERMQKLSQEKLEKLWQERDEHFPLKSIQELVILASIVEKEASRDDRTEVASVFLNRLRRQMPLQADACVIYSLTRENKSFLENKLLTHKHLRLKDPYNTYIARGLPPGPICNPGLDAILAVLKAKPGDNFYFVVRPEGGGHIFSQNLLEHHKNVQAWRATRKNV